MSTSADLLLVTTDPDTERAVIAVIWDLPGDPIQFETCQDLNQLKVRFDKATTPVVLVDIDGDPLARLRELEPLIARHAGTRFIVLCKEFEESVVLEAMQVGARHCLIKGTVSSKLPSVLDRMLSPVSTEENRGRVVTVLSASGGCGATTVAINLAEECRLDTDKPSLLVDLDVHYGAIATYLGVRSQYGIADVLAHDGSIDAQLVGSTASAHAEDLHVLLSPVSINFSAPDPVDFSRIDALLGACQDAYHCTVIDAPRVSMDVAASLAQASHLTIVLFELSVVDIRSARAILEALKDRGAPMDRVVPVANRYSKRRATPSLEDARQALGDLAVMQIANDFTAALRAINLGKPVATVAPRSPLRKGLRKIATQVYNPSGAST